MFATGIHVWKITKDKIPFNRDLANTTRFWDAGDGEDLFESNKEDPRMDSIYLSGDPIVYDFNDHGYRCKDFHKYEDNKFILVLGCSHTHGTGLHQEHIWHSYLGAYMDLPIMNLGNGGFGPDYVFTMSALYNKINMPRPKMVVIQWPQKFRKSFTYEGLELDPCHPEQEDIPYLDDRARKYDTRWYFNRYITYNDEMEKINYVNYSATQLMWECPVFNWSWEGDYENSVEENFLKVYTQDLGKARDLQHDGRLIHQEAANQVYRGMENVQMV